MNSNVLTEQHHLQTRIHTRKCNLFNLIPKLLSPNIRYDSTVTYQTKKTHLPHQDGRYSGRRSSLQRFTYLLCSSSDTFRKHFNAYVAGIIFACEEALQHV